jgi:hypothetical protein
MVSLPRDAAGLNGTDAIGVDNGDQVHDLLRFPFASRAVSGSGVIATTGRSPAPDRGWRRLGVL